MTYEVYHSEKDERHAFEGWYYKDTVIDQGPFATKSSATRMAKKARKHDEWFLSRGRERALNVSQMQGY